MFDPSSSEICSFEHYDDSLESIIALSLDENVKDVDLLNSVKLLEGQENFFFLFKSQQFEKVVSFNEKPYPKLELKYLPAHLKYVFLGANETYSVIISSSLSQSEIDKLLQVLHDHKTSIA